jgi:hypothetical protein
VIPTPKSSRPIPAFAPSREGDDLAFAREFVDQSVAGMRELPVHDHSAIHAWLDYVESSARSLQARAIARSVVEARADVGSDRVYDSIGSVGSLIAQYEQGLVDVEAQLEAGERLSPSENIVASALSREERFEDARRTLEGLLPNVDHQAQSEALKKLMAFVPPAADIDDVNDLDETDFASLDLVSPTPTKPDLHKLVDRPAFDVEALLPGLVDHAHRLARLQGKSLTASYAARDALLNPALAHDWQEAVELAIGALIDTTLEDAQTRRAEGLTAAAHMALTAEGQGDEVELRITCPGHDVPRFDVEAPHTLDAGHEDGTVWVRFIARESAPAMASPQSVTR